MQRYDAVADFGDHELVASGLHENFHSARYLDTHMARTAAILGHLADGDRLTARMQRRSDYALLKFAPAHALSVRAIVAGPSRFSVTDALSCRPSARAACAPNTSCLDRALLTSMLTPALLSCQYDACVTLRGCLQLSGIIDHMVLLIFM